MELEEIRGLMREFAGLGLEKLEVERDGFSLRLQGGTSANGASQVAGEILDFSAVTLTSAQSLESYSLREVRSPLVGTAYMAPSPDADPYVIVGQRVEKGAVLCLVEAMKMMNEVTAPVAGVIKAICFENGQLVSFDQVLVELEEG